jgi:hypothetical protein
LCPAGSTGTYPNCLTPQAPYCTLTANPTFVSHGQSSTLFWSSQNAINAQLSSFGTVGVNGSTNVSPYQTTTYTLTVWNNQGQQATCQTTVQLNYQPPYNPPTYYPPQPPTIYPPITYYPPSIPVSNIPYTGTGSTTGNVILMSLIVLASISGAYLILYSRGGARNMLVEAGILQTSRL